METLTWTFVDKSTWGEGSWRSEPDKIQWESRVGIPCLALRGPPGSWCGYVGLVPGQPLYGIGYSACVLRPVPCEDAGFYCSHTPGSFLNVHGGLTFSGACQKRVHGICHVPAPQELDTLWWFGFDCAHLGDFSPGMAAIRRTVCGAHAAQRARWEAYCTLAFVQAECEQLALQLTQPDLLVQLQESPHV